MSNIVVSRQVDIDRDRNRFQFLGLPHYCETLAALADVSGWVVERSGVSKRGAWIQLSKLADDAHSFPEFYRAIKQADLIGRLAPEEG